MLKVTGLTFVLALAFSSCGESKSLSYEYEANGCNTGKHTLSSHEELCAALKNDAINDSEKLGRGCAKSLRRQAFQEHGCTGEF